MSNTACGKNGWWTNCRYSAANMLAMLETVRSRYGGVENYLKQKCGFEDDDIQRIRLNIIENGHSEKLNSS